METITLSDVKVFYDQNHQPREVLMSYDIFQKMVVLTERVKKDKLFRPLSNGYWEFKSTCQPDESSQPTLSSGIG